MIIVYHKNNKIKEVVTLNNQKIKFDYDCTIAKGLIKLANQFPDCKIIWCSLIYKNQLNIKEIEKLFHQNKMLLSFNPNDINYFGSKIGFIEDTPFININKKVNYPTWQMSSVVGVVHASFLNKIKDIVIPETNFDYYLNSIAKICMPLGLLCYSEPALLKTYNSVDFSRSNNYNLFRFVKQHYKTRWVFILLLNIMIYKRRFVLIPFLFSLFYKNRYNLDINLDDIDVESSKKVIGKETIDVIIPTMGRDKYLYDVLCDLRNQTHLPKNVIIVEQNAIPESVSELHYLNNEIWPFKIDHTLIYQLGACNARNIALAKVKSDWVFFADDDIRFKSKLLEDSFRYINLYTSKAINLSCLQNGEKELRNVMFQSTSFGSGTSIVKSDLIKNIKFNKAYEFGYGEDADFGMQLRNMGTDILYIPFVKIRHLKAPTGGFRKKIEQEWDSEIIIPKPSPTVMVYKLKYATKEQLQCYKTILFLKYYKTQSTKNPIKYYKLMTKKWHKSLLWAKYLINKYKDEV